MYVLKTSTIWNKILNEVSYLSKKEPILSNFYYHNILKHSCLSASLSYILASKLLTANYPEINIQDIFNNIYLKNNTIMQCVIQDIQAIYNRDPAVQDYLTPFLYFKGFHALETYRLSHYLWNVKNKSLATYLHSRMSSEFSVDIHPASRIGSGVMLDHATGIVIGENVVVENNVSIFHSVTLGGTGKNYGENRHPKIRKKVVIGAGAKILGNIEVGLGSKIGAGSIVLKNVPSNVTVAGVPAKIISVSDHQQNSSKKEKNKFLSMHQFQYGDGI